MITREGRRFQAWCGSAATSLHASASLREILPSPVARRLALAADTAEDLALGLGLGAGGAGEDALGLALAELGRGRLLRRRGRLGRRLRLLLPSPSSPLALSILP